MAEHKASSLLVSFASSSVSSKGLFSLRLFFHEKKEQLCLREHIWKSIRDHACLIRGAKALWPAEPIPVFDRTGNCVFLAPPFSYSLDRKERSHVLCWRSRFPLLLLGIWMLMRFLLITIPHVLPPSPWMDLDRLGMDVEKEKEEEERLLFWQKPSHKNIWRRRHISVSRCFCSC